MKFRQKGCKKNDWINNEKKPNTNVEHVIKIMVKQFRLKTLDEKFEIARNHNAVT